MNFKFGPRASLSIIKQTYYEPALFDSTRPLCLFFISFVFLFGYLQTRKKINLLPTKLISIKGKVLIFLNTQNITSCLLLYFGHHRL